MATLKRIIHSAKTHQIFSFHFAKLRLDDIVIRDLVGESKQLLELPTTADLFRQVIACE
jgi:hypothetical protein